MEYGTRVSLRVAGDHEVGFFHFWGEDHCERARRQVAPLIATEERTSPSGEITTVPAAPRAGYHADHHVMEPCTRP